MLLCLSVSNIAFHISESGEEYGIQFDSATKALEFRHLIFDALLSTASTVVEAECAIAEYDTKSREFVIVSKVATVRLSTRPSDEEMFITIEEQRGGDEVYRIFTECLTKDVQMWPAVQTFQLTFWGIHHQAVGIDKIMFLMEMDPGVVGQTTINKFFGFLSTALQDKTFAAVQEEENQLPSIDDEDFDLGPLGGMS